MNISNNPLLQKQQEAESTISGIPYVVSSNASSLKGHYFTSFDGIERNTNFLSITNTGTSGSLFVSFVSGGFSTGKYFTLSAQETFSKKLSLSKVFISGVAAQPYEIVAGLTNMENKDSAASRFVPSDISDCFAWWKADSGITLSGTTVAVWTDEVNGRVLQNSVKASQPTYVSSTVTFNNRPTLAFDGTDDQLVSDLSKGTWSFLHDMTGSTIAVVCRTNVISLLQSICGTSAAGTSLTGRCVVLNYNTTSMMQNRLSISGSATYDTLASAFPYVVQNNTIYCISALDTGSTLRMRRLNSSTAYSTVTISSPYLDSREPEFTFRVGYAGFPFLNGNIAEVVIYNKTLTQDEMTKLSEYFVKKYGALV